MIQLLSFFDDSKANIEAVENLDFKVIARLVNDGFIFEIGDNFHTSNSFPTYLLKDMADTLASELNLGVTPPYFYDANMHKAMTSPITGETLLLKLPLNRFKRKKFKKSKDNDTNVSEEPISEPSFNP